MYKNAELKLITFETLSHKAQRFVIYNLEGPYAVFTAPYSQRYIILTYSQGLSVEVHLTLNKKAFAMRELVNDIKIWQIYIYKVFEFK